VKPAAGNATLQLVNARNHRVAFLVTVVAERNAFAVNAVHDEPASARA
jgi:hypothetical protein